jgi:large subunit ribosomal protein L23
MNRKNSKNKKTKKISRDRHAVSRQQEEPAIIKPYITEKTFNMIEKENKLSFLVSSTSTKKEIIQAVKFLYETDALSVNTARTIKGKKAIVEFRDSEGARELATKLGLV